MTPRRRNRDSALREYLASCDWTPIAVMTLLLAAGLLFIHSTGLQAVNGLPGGFFYRQLAWIGLGWCAFFLTANFDYRHWQVLSPLFYIFCLILLATVLFFAEPVYGARRWLDLGLMNLQPSELTKLALVLLLASFLARPDFDINRPFGMVLCAVIVLVPFVLIFLEPDLGSAMILLPLAAVPVFAGGLKGKYIMIATAVVLIGGAAFAANEYFRIRPLLKEYHRDRIRVFFNPESDPLARGYQQRQARLALGSGGWSGKGLGNGTQHLLGFLPQSAANNDFIFSVIAEETGFLGTGALLLLYALLLASIVKTALGCDDPLGKLLAVGVAAFIFLHVFINISVNIGLMPVKGLSLPFISYGGSFILMCMAAMGIVQSVHRFGKED